MTHNHYDHGEVIAVPKGNPFRLSLCPQRIAPAQRSASFADITDLSVRLTRQNWDGQDADYELTEEGDIIINVPSTLKCVTYGLELSGTYNGDPWRWADCSVFRVTDCNPCSSVNPMETFGIETYYIYDDIITSFNEEKLLLETHGHAWFEGDTLHLMESEGTEIDILKDTLIIKEYGRESIENCNTRPSRQCYC